MEPIQDDAAERSSGNTYRIRVSGILGEEWSQRTQGMTVVSHRLGTEGNYTDLIGALRDEAALMGVLDALYSHGAKLQRVEQLHENHSSAGPPPGARITSFDNP